MKWASRTSAAVLIVALFLLAPSFCPAADVLRKGQPAPEDGLFFDGPTSANLLREVEDGRSCQREVELLTALSENQKAELTAHEEKGKACAAALGEAKKGGGFWARLRSGIKIFVSGALTGAAIFMAIAL